MVFEFFEELIKDAFEFLVESSGTLGLTFAIFVLILFMIIQAIIAPIASEAVLAAAGGIFNEAFGAVGIAGAIIGGIIGSMLGAITAFFIARWVKSQVKVRFIAPTIESESKAADNPLTTKQKIAHFLARFMDKDSEYFMPVIEQYGFMIVLIGRLLPVVPFDAISYGAGLTEIKYRDFIIATFLGAIPRVTFYVYVVGAFLGGELSEGSFTSFILIVLAFAVGLYGTYRLILYYLRKNGNSETSEFIATGDQLAD